MILVLGGTTEGRQLALELQHNGYPCLLSVVTELGAKMAGDGGLRMRIGELDAGAFIELLQREQVRLVIDATHPYATVIKEIARNGAAEAGAVYVRFERPTAILPGDRSVITVKDYTDALGILQKEPGGILFTIGVKNLAHFKLLWSEQKRPVWVKIYPELQSLTTCRELGLQPEQIFAFHGFGSKEILKAIINMTGVSWIVTKESGSTGGIDVKAAAVSETGKTLLVINRPPNKAGLVFSSINEVLEFVKKSKGVLI